MAALSLLHWRLHSLGQCALGKGPVKRNYPLDEGSDTPKRVNMIQFRIFLMLALLFPCVVVQPAAGQPRQATAQEVTAIHNCAAKYQDDVDEAERQCVFNLVAEPCTKKPEAVSNLGTTDCYRVEWVIWDNLLNENFK